MDNFLAHILVVDDDDGIRSLVKKFFSYGAIMGLLMGPKSPVYVKK